jgi:FtsP/CotA-like multicopper oxidase with cupredoxin domain
MTDDLRHDPAASPGVNRRAVLFGGAGALGSVLLGTQLTMGRATALRRTSASAGAGVAKAVHLAGTDGWVSMPAGSPPDLPFFPDSLAPDGFDTYIFGFRDVTQLATAEEVAAVRGRAQLSAPILAFDEGDDVTITLSNLGLLMRPDLFDGHTLHWHGFVNAIPLFDGVPELSLAVPIGRDLSYFYRPHDAGTYMYHCHFEDVEHVQMGMTGVVFVRPAQNGTVVGDVPSTARLTYAYNDGDGSTRYDREFTFMLTELWSAAHYRDAHIQVSDWTDYAPSFWLLNGRGYPDTIAAPGNPMSTAAGRLQYQPISSLMTCNVGETVLLRIANLGYQNHSLTLDNVDLQVIAKDASLLRGRGGYTNYQVTNTVDVGPGESRDVLVTPHRTGEFLLYDRNYAYLGNGGGTGWGGMMTVLRVGAAGTYGPQTEPNT